MSELNTVARPYSKAAFEYAQEHGNLDQWTNGLALAAEVAKDSLLAEKVLGNPALTFQQKAEIVLSVFAEDQLDQAGKNFVFLLAENGRLALLPVIAAQFEMFKAAMEKTVDVDLTTAYPLADEQQHKLAQALGNKLGRDVNLTSNVDKSIIGGVVIRADDLVIDGSVRARLAKLAEAMNS